MNKPKTKKVKKDEIEYKLTREQYIKKYNPSPNAIKALLATQYQPIKEESKDIEPFKTLFTYSRNYPDLCATQTPEFKKWVKQVTDTLNSLTKRNIK